VSWLPILGDFFIHHFFPSLLYYNETEDFTDLYSCRRVNKWFRAHLNPPRVRLTPSKFRSFDRMRAIAPVVQKLICRNFSDGLNMTRLVESAFFGSGKALRTIQFVDSDLKPAPLALLYGNLHRLQSLTKLDMGYNHLNDQALSAMVKSCSWSSSIVDLCLPAVYSWAQTTSDSLSTLLLNFTSLLRLQLKICGGESERMFGAVFASVAHLTRLQTLVMEVSYSVETKDNYINYGDIAEMLGALRRLRSLDLYCSTQLSLFHQGTQFELQRVDLTPLYGAIQSHPSLTELALPKLPVSPSFFEMIAQQQIITSLSLCGIPIKKNTCGALSSAIRENKTLTSLDISQCTALSSDDFEELARGLAANSTLRDLTMRGVAVRDSGLLDPVFRALVHQSSITRLDLELNWLSPTGVEALGKALETNTTLTYLSVAPGTHAGLFDGLRTNVALRTLKVVQAEMKGAPAASFAAALAENRSLVCVEISHCRLPREGYNLAVAALERNSSLSLLILRRTSLTSDSEDVESLASTANIKAKIVFL
jgi:hypothetical protein